METPLSRNIVRDRHGNVLQGGELLAVRVCACRGSKPQDHSIYMWICREEDDEFQRQETTRPRAGILLDVSERRARIAGRGQDGYSIFLNAWKNSACRGRISWKQIQSRWEMLPVRELLKKAVKLYGWT